MKSINLLPREIIRRNELNRFFILNAAIWAVIFLLTILLVLVLSWSSGNISRSIDNYVKMTADKKYFESDAIAESACDIRSDVSELITGDQIDLGIIIFVAETAVKTRDADVSGGFLYIDELKYGNNDLEITGTASNRGLILEFALALRQEGIFADIEIPSISRLNNLHTFKLMLKTLE